MHVVRQIWEEERIPERMERNNNSSYIQKRNRDRCEKNRGIALGNAAYKI